LRCPPILPAQPTRSRDSAATTSPPRTPQYQTESLPIHSRRGTVLDCGAGKHSALAGGIIPQQLPLPQANYSCPKQSSP
jgi:hypothetical protein